jgi:hypothetical protein
MNFVCALISQMARLIEAHNRQWGPKMARAKQNLFKLSL